MLSAYKVLDLSGRLGWLAGRIMVDLGADVIKVEPFGTDLDGTEWRALNLGKRLLRLDPSSPAGRRIIEKAIPGIDVLLESTDPTDEWLRPDRTAALNPDLIHVSITPYGRVGPRAAWRGTDLEMMAASGAMSLAGEPGGTPLRISAPQAHAWAGAHAASGAMIALIHRSQGGGGQHVDVSAQASIIAALAHAPTFVDMMGTVPSRAGSNMTGRSIHGAEYKAFWPCADGFINFVIYGGPAGRRTNKALIAWMREKNADLGVLADIDWNTFDPKLADQDEVDRLEAPIARFFQDITKAEFLEGACAREMLGYPVSTVADISADPQLEARGFWCDVPTPDGGKERHCGAFYITDGERPETLSTGMDPAAEGRRILKDFGYSETEIDGFVDERVVGAA